MGAATDFAALKNPTAGEVLAVFRKNGLPLSVVNGQLDVPDGITHAMTLACAQHETELVSLLTVKEEEDGSQR